MSVGKQEAKTNKKHNKYYPIRLCVTNIFD